MNRINTICQYIEPNSIVCDVGSDHALLCKTLKKQKSVSFFYNVENKIKPFEQTKKNVIGLENVCCVFSNGLDFNFGKIDYCVCSGVGANNIIKILKNENAKKCKYFLLLPHSHPWLLERFLLNQDFLVINTQYIFCKNHMYKLFFVSKK